MGTAPRRVASTGIDVAVSLGLDVVILDESLRVAFGPTTLHRADLAGVIRRSQPHVIAIESPPAWGSSGKSRRAERQLQALGINIFPTPAAEFARSLHGWIKVGCDVFGAVRNLGYPLYTGGAPSAHSAIEVFPHASAVRLRGSLAPVGVAKSEWRRAVLENAGVDSSELRTADHLDAALAALTGLKFLTGEFSVVGTPGEAVLVLPINEMPTTRFARGELGSPAVGWIRCTPHDDRSLTKPAIHAAAAVAPSPTTLPAGPRCEAQVEAFGPDAGGQRVCRRRASKTRLEPDRGRQGKPVSLASLNRVVAPGRPPGRFEQLAHL